MPDIFRIKLLVISRPHGEWFPCFAKQLIRLLIHAYHRPAFIVRAFINIQDILHTGYKFCIFFWRDTPVAVAVRSKFVFLKPFRSCPCLQGHPVLLWPFLPEGGVSIWSALPAPPQAISISFASARPSTLRFALSELTLRFNFITESIPSSM